MKKNKKTLCGTAKDLKNIDFKVSERIEYSRADHKFLVSLFWHKRSDYV